MKTLIITLPALFGKEYSKLIEQQVHSKEVLGRDKNRQEFIKITYLEEKQPEIDKILLGIKRLDDSVLRMTGMLDRFLHEVVAEVIQVLGTDKLNS